MSAPLARRAFFAAGLATLLGGARSVSADSGCPAPDVYRQRPGPLSIPVYPEWRCDEALTVARVIVPEVRRGDVLVAHGDVLISSRAHWERPLCVDTRIQYRPLTRAGVALDGCAGPTDWMGGDVMYHPEAGQLGAGPYLARTQHAVYVVDRDAPSGEVRMLAMAASSVADVGARIGVYYQTFVVMRTGPGWQGGAKR